MANPERELDAFLNNRNTLGALADLYETTMKRVVEEMASGVSRPGAARLRELATRIDDLLGKLNPRKQGQLREWVRENVRKAYVLGDEQATRELRDAMKALASGERWTITSAWTPLNDQSVNAVTRMMLETLGKVHGELSAYLKTTIRQTQIAYQQSEQVINATTSGYLRGVTGQRIRDDIAAALLGDKISPAVRERLQRVGFSAPLFNRFERIARQEVITAGSKTYNVSTYAELVARTQLKEVQKVAVVARTRQNGVDHLRMTWHEMPEPDECSPFAGKVYYNGPLAEDPLGFPRWNLLPSNGDFHPNCRHRFAGYVVFGRSDEEIQQELEAVNKIPKILFGKTGAQVRKILDEMDPGMLAELSKPSVPYAKMMA